MLISPLQRLRLTSELHIATHCSVLPGLTKHAYHVLYLGIPIFIKLFLDSAIKDWSFEHAKSSGGSTTKVNHCVQISIVSALLVRDMSIVPKVILKIL